MTKWMSAGHRQNPAPGVAAITITNPDGHRTEVHAPFGLVQDLPDGTASERSWTPDGQLTLEIRRFNDHLWDSDSGEPAYRRWDDEGTLVQELHFEQSKERTRHNPKAPRRVETAYYARTEPVERFEG